MNTYDIAGFQGYQLSGKARPTQSLWDQAGANTLSTGIVKLCQRILLELLTIKGSRPFLPDRGSSLLLRAQQGHLRSEIDAHLAGQQALTEIEAALLAEETDVDPADMRYARVDIAEVLFTPGMIHYTLAVTSRAGTTRTVALPVATL